MDLKYNGLINQHLIFNTDDSNITSKNNGYIYNQILVGNYESPLFDYLSVSVKDLVYRNTKVPSLELSYELI